MSLADRLRPVADVDGWLGEYCEDGGWNGKAEWQEYKRLCIPLRPDQFTPPVGVIGMRNA